MAYTLPQVIVRQLFVQRLSEVVQPFYPCIIGPHWKLIRYGTETSDDTFLATYDGTEQTVAWPGHTAAGYGAVDEDYVQVDAVDALLRYYRNSSGDADEIHDRGNHVIWSDTIIWKDYGSWTRQAGRDPTIDVAVGDWVKLEYGDYELLTQVLGFVYDTVASSVGTATEADGNSGTGMTVTSGGTYTGAADTTYIVTIAVDGSDYTLTVRTTTGLDSSGPHTYTLGTNQSIGNYGVTININGTPADGDIYLVPATAESNGAIHGLTLANTIPVPLRHRSSSSSSSSSLGPIPGSMYETDLQVSLYIKDDVTVVYKKLDSPGDYNYEIDQTNGITLNASITSLHSRTGTTYLPMESASCYVTYRVIDLTYAYAVDSLETSSDVETTLGSIEPDSELPYAVYKSLQNSNGSAVKFLALQSNDATGWNAAVDILSNEDEVYYLVPLTQTVANLTIVKTHVDAMRAAGVNKWRRMFISRELPDYFSVTTGMATVTDQGGSNILVTVPLGGLIAAAVRSGDIFRCNYETDAWGDTSYESYTIDEVVDDDTMTLSSGPSSPVPIPATFQIYRDKTKAEEATQIATYSSSYADQVVCNVWPDEATDDNGETVAGYHLAAAIAGFKSSVVPHQPITNFLIEGFSAVPKASAYFSRTQLDTIAEGGTLIVDMETDGASPFIRHQLTTDYTSVETRELSVVVNVDGISYAIANTLDRFKGRINITDQNIEMVRATIEGAIDAYSALYLTNDAGSAVLSYEITEIGRNEILRDHLEADCDVQVPAPMNVLDITLRIETG